MIWVVINDYSIQARAHYLKHHCIELVFLLRHCISSSNVYWIVMLVVQLKIY